MKTLIKRTLPRKARD